MAVDKVFQLAAGQYTPQELYSSQLITTGTGNKVSKVLQIPAGADALEVVVKYEDANRSVKVRIYNSVDEETYETTPTAEYEITDEKQIVKFDRWDLSAFVKVEIEAYTQNCTVSVKARVAI